MLWPSRSITIAQKHYDCTRTAQDYDILKGHTKNNITAMCVRLSHNVIITDFMHLL